MAQGDWRDQLNFSPVGAHTQNSSLSSAVTLTIPDGASKIMLQVQTQNVRLTIDGTAPTTSKGFQLKAGNPALLIPLGRATALKVIEEAATAVLDYQFGD